MPEDAWVRPTSEESSECLVRFRKKWLKQMTLGDSAVVSVLTSITQVSKITPYLDSFQMTLVLVLIRRF